MNKYLEALDTLKNIQVYKYATKEFYDYQVSYENSEEVETLQELVDRATPIKPNRVICRTQISEYSTMIEHKVYCPICNTKILIEGNCCPNNDCRQAIDWGKDE